MLKLDNEIQQLLKALENASLSAAETTQQLDRVRKLLTERRRVLMPVSLRINKLHQLRPAVLAPGIDIACRAE